MAMKKKQIVVVGSGVIGLTCAYRLLEAGYGVTVLARTLPPNTTSDVAAAYWSPPTADSSERIVQWAFDSLTMFEGLTAEPGSGVQILDFYKLYSAPMAMPVVPKHKQVSALAPEQFPGDWHGYQTEIPRIDVPIYMPWLLKQVQAKGGLVLQRIVQNFREINQEYPIIINCAGLGARLLTGDDVFPIRGQVMSVRKPPAFPDLILNADEQDSTTYVIARSQDCLLGGTYQYYNGEMAVDSMIADGIRMRCAHFFPALADAELLQHKVGLRPGRSAVRLEHEQLATGQRLIHNYGHGSVGHTLSWGCAAEVVQRVREAIE